MKTSESGYNSKKRVKKLKNLMLLVDILIIFAMATIISLLTIRKTDEALKSRVVSTVNALNVQMQMNLDSYLYRMETIGTLVFADETVYKYSPVNAEDEYEAIKTESYIADYLYRVCIMENFVDFSIVYENNHHVGKMSNGTTKLFGDNLYTDLKAMINRPVTADGWYAGYEGNYKRIYYVKQLNDEAVLVLSFYTAELDDVFEHPGGIEDITVQLADKNDIVIYSSDDKENGLPLSPEITGRINGKTSVALMDDDYLIALNECGDMWRVVCSAPSELILKEKNEVTVFVYLTALAAALLAAVVSILFISSIIAPVNRIVDSLADEASTDLLTGVLNKRTFEKKVEEALRSGDPEQKKALILLDVDNFKGVNDTLGHAYGDKVLAEIGDILKLVFQPGDLLGRLGGDEFCVYLNINELRQDTYMAHIEEKCQELCEMFHNNYTGDDGKYKISASIGAAVFPDNGDTFQDLYHCADKALYESKHRGKDIFTIYSNETEGEE